jgi:DNA-binding transcriptional MerR regulator
VSIKTIRVYHDKGLLPEPDRDSSGYRQYTAQDAIELIKIRTLAEAGVPLARIRELGAAPVDDFRHAVVQIDGDVAARVRALQQTRRRLRALASGHTNLLPEPVDDHIRHLRELGFTKRWAAMETDLWILVFATHADVALELFRDQSESLTEPGLRKIYLDYDRAHDLDPQDPRIDDLARRIVDATTYRYGSGELPGQSIDSDIPQLIQGFVNASSPAWQRLDSLIRDGLHSVVKVDRRGDQS